MSVNLLKSFVDTFATSARMPEPSSRNGYRPRHSSGVREGTDVKLPYMARHMQPVS